MRLGPFGRRPAAEEGSGESSLLIVGLGNPGSRYAGTRHNVGFDVASALIERWELPRAKSKFGGLLTGGRIRPTGPRVSVLLPQNFMNESGNAAGPALGSLRLPVSAAIAIHDEIDLSFGQIRTKQGGGVAGHNGLKSLDRGFGSRDFWRVRVGVDRPDGTDPELVSRWVLGRFSEDVDAVRGLVEEAADEIERLVDRLASEDREGEEG